MRQLIYHNCNMFVHFDCFHCTYINRPFSLGGSILPSQTMLYSLGNCSFIHLEIIHSYIPDLKIWKTKSQNCYKMVWKGTTNRPSWKGLFQRSLARRRNHYISYNKNFNFRYCDRFNTLIFSLIYLSSCYRIVCYWTV